MPKYGHQVAECSMLVMGLGIMYNVVDWVCTSFQCASWQTSHTSCLGTRLAVKIDLSGDLDDFNFSF